MHSVEVIASNREVHVSHHGVTHIVHGFLAWDWDVLVFQISDCRLLYHPCAHRRPVCAEDLGRGVIVLDDDQVLIRSRTIEILTCSDNCASSVVEDDTRDACQLILVVEHPSDLTLTVVQIVDEAYVRRVVI